VKRTGRVYFHFHLSKKVIKSRTDYKVIQVSSFYAEFFSLFNNADLINLAHIVLGLHPYKQRNLAISNQRDQTETAPFESNILTF